MLDRKEDLDSDFKEPSTPFWPLFMRKKFLSFCGNGEWPLACLDEEDIEKPEKLRFSLVLGVVLGEGEELKSVVIS